MLIAHHSTATAITPHAADRSWVVFLQTAFPAGVMSPIRIVGMDGAEISRELKRHSAMNAYEVQIIGLIPSTEPDKHAQAIGEQYTPGHLHDGWYLPSADLIAFIHHHAKTALKELLSRVHPAAMGDELVDLHEIARLLNVSEPTVRRMIAAGRIPYMRVGREYRFNPSEVVAALQAGR